VWFDSRDTLPIRFSTALLNWYRHSHRDLPWRRTRNAWHILVSEVMLQQTRATAVIPYYHRFLAAYPTPEALAAAPEQDLLAQWAGLGYYSRARNLQKAAQTIAAAGKFPDTYEEIRELPGVGDYTAAAVASIAFGRPHAVLDGNVMRVLTRMANDGADIGSPSTRKRLQATADTLLDRQHPDEFNQAIMELGATLCTPKNPQCLLCPVQADCEGRKAGRAHELPVKLRKAETIEEERTLLIIHDRQQRLLLRKRTQSDRRLAGFHELPDQEDLPKTKPTRPLGSFRHGIVNHSYTFHVAAAPAPKTFPGPDWLWATSDQLTKIPLSTTARKALKLFHSEQSGKKGVPPLVAAGSK
jgi:A/G-specific adenine glycosylase